MDFEVITEEEYESQAPQHDGIVAYANVPEQHGPLRQFERAMRCASRGCGSSTFFKLQGIPYCMIHCLRRLNEMLYEMGVER